MYRYRKVTELVLAREQARQSLVAPSPCYRACGLKWVRHELILRYGRLLATIQ